MRQTILGAGGAIGIELAKALKNYSTEIRLFSRNPEKANPDDELVSGNILNLSDVQKAVKDSSIAYLTAGLAYNTKVWKKDWPKLIDNVISACKENNCKLVFFDNIYVYDKEYMNNITEETPLNPPSEKGKVRLEVYKKIMSEVEKGNLKALIARCADYYGPGITNTSLLIETVFNPLSKEKKANWMSSVNFKHSFTYTPDAGKATAILGNTEEVFNQVWHLPTAMNPLTGEEWIKSVANKFGVQPKFRVASKGMLSIMGLFVPVLKESVEMLYQYDRNYIFNSEKFEKKFNFTPTSYKDGIKEIIEKDYR